MTVHSGTKTREFQAWWRMKQSCNDKNYSGYPSNGGKGVTYEGHWDTYVGFISDMGPMPEGCNALIRIDRSIHYCKHNCMWGSRPQGRPRVKEPKKEKKETKRKRMKNPKYVYLCMEEKHYDYIAAQARFKSQQKGCFVSPNDMIREALTKAFPCPEMFDLFGGKR